MKLDLVMIEEFMHVLCTCTCSSVKHSPSMYKNKKLKNVTRCRDSRSVKRLFLFVSLFLSSRCMLKLKIAIYFRVASLPSQASYAVLAEESLAFFKHPRTPTLFLIQQPCIIITFHC